MSRRRSLLITNTLIATLAAVGIVGGARAQSEKPVTVIASR